MIMIALGIEIETAEAALFLLRSVMKEMAKKRLKCVGARERIIETIPCVIRDERFGEKRMKPSGSL